MLAVAENNLCPMSNFGPPSPVRATYRHMDALRCLNIDFATSVLLIQRFIETWQVVHRGQGWIAGGDLPGNVGLPQDGQLRRLPGMEDNGFQWACGSMVTWSD